MPGGNFVCYRCQKCFPDHYKLQRHYDKKKKCVSIGTIVEPSNFYCESCNTSYTNKSHYAAHLKTKLHERMSTIHITNSNIENSFNTNQINNNVNIQINLTPRELTNPNFEYLPSLTAPELKNVLGLDVKNLEETILNVFRTLHTDPMRTENHNLLLEDAESALILVYKVGSWRLEDKFRALNDSICQCTVHLLELEHTIKECMSENDFRTFSRYRDEIEHESANQTDDRRLQGILHKVSDILAEFTKERLQTVEHAKERAKTAKAIKYRVSERMREWVPGGKLYLEAWNNMISS